MQTKMMALIGFVALFISALVLIVVGASSATLSNMIPMIDPHMIPMVDPHMIPMIDPH